MAVNDTVQLSVIGTAEGQDHIHTLHFRLNSLVAGEQDLIDKWQANARTTYRAIFEPTSSPCVRYVARQVCGSVPLRAPIEETEVAPNIVGSNASGTDRLPSLVAAVVSVRSAYQGRTKRGRFFVGGLNESMADASYLNAAGKTIIQNYVTALLAAFGPGGTQAADYALVIHSRKLAAGGVDCTVSSTAVTGMIVRDALGTMRSRKPGHGN